MQPIGYDLIISLTEAGFSFGLTEYGCTNIWGAIFCCKTLKKQFTPFNSTDGIFPSLQISNFIVNWNIKL